MCQPLYIRVVSAWMWKCIERRRKQSMAEWICWIPGCLIFGETLNLLGDVPDIEIRSVTRTYSS